jgi:hypothetical protein
MPQKKYIAKVFELILGHKPAVHPAAPAGEEMFLSPEKGHRDAR